MPSSTRVSAPTPRASGSLSMRTRARRAADAVACVLARSRARMRVQNACPLAVVVIAPSDAVVVDALGASANQVHGPYPPPHTSPHDRATRPPARRRDDHGRRARERARSPLGVARRRRARRGDERRWSSRRRWCQGNIVFTVIGERAHADDTHGDDGDE